MSARYKATAFLTILPLLLHFLWRLSTIGTVISCFPCFLLVVLLMGESYCVNFSPGSLSRQYWAIMPQDFLKKQFYSIIIFILLSNFGVVRCSQEVLRRPRFSANQVGDPRIQCSLDHGGPTICGHAYRTAWDAVVGMESEGTTCKDVP